MKQDYTGVRAAAVRAVEDVLSRSIRCGVKSVLFAVFVLFNACLHVAVADDAAQPRLPSMQLQINDTLLTAEIAATNQQRYMGLSFRASLDDNAGMLFVYPNERLLSFTMRNTLIPLSIAFISQDLIINEIHQMNVGPGQIFDSIKKAQYALEVDQGWFAANNIKVGDQIIRR